MALAERNARSKEIYSGGLKRPLIEIVTVVGYHLYVERHLRSDDELPTILFVNGALTTTSSLRWATQLLTDYNIIAFDFPIFGQSEMHNRLAHHLTKEDEVSILLALCERYQPDFIVSLSWGGTSTLLALTERPQSVRKAIISSYSFGMSLTMRALAEELVQLIDLDKQDAASRLTVDELGEKLPFRIRQLYLRYFMRLSALQLKGVANQIRYMLELEPSQDVAKLEGIEIPLLFGNGSDDRFTSPESVRPIARFVLNSSFATIANAGHFLAIESPRACTDVCDGIRSFLAV